MKKCIVFLLILVVFTCSTRAATEKSNLGIGLAKFNFDTHTVITFYKDTTDAKPSQKLVFFEDTSINDINIKHLKKYQASWLKPEAIWLEYNVLVFRVDFKTNKWFRLIVDNESGQCLWVHRSSKTMFYTWEKFLKKCISGVERYDAKDNPIRVKPDSTAKILKITRNVESLNVVKVKGDWMQVSKSLDENGDLATDSKPIGWILWRKNDELLVSFFYTC